MTRHDTFKLFVSLVLPQAVGGLSSVFVFDSVLNWYTVIERPSFTPPDWIFGPVWTTLYVLMGIAAFLVWRRGLKTKGVPLALSLFLIQLLLNGLWSVLFFGLHSIGGALIELLVLYVFILLSLWSFYRVEKVAAVLLLPYLLWSSFAFVLNYNIYLLN